MRTALIIAACVGFLGYRLKVARLAHKKPQPRLVLPLHLRASPRQLYRYQPVAIELLVRRPDGRPAKLKRPPALKILFRGKPVTTVADVEAILMKYDPSAGCYRAFWPPPWGAEPGDYVVEVRQNIHDPDKWQWGPWRPKITRDAVCEAVAVDRFTIRARRPKPMPTPLCAVTWEPQPPEGQLLAPDGRRTNWRALVEWAQFIGADALWCRGAVTQASKRWSLSMQQPFAPINEDLLARLGSEAHRRGLKFGLWAVAYATLPHGRNAGKPQYEFAKIMRPDGSFSDGDFISLLDPDRPKHLAQWMQHVAGFDWVDMVGLDYIRPDKGDYQVTDGFARTMPVELPEQWDNWSRQQRWRWVAKMVEKRWRREPRFYEMWNWYRCHLVAKRVREIVARAAIDKPVWCFIFGWRAGRQSGQDPVMLTDAGADALAIMLYQCPTVSHYEQMVRDWSRYKAAGQARLIPGDQVDDFWHQHLRNPAAPEELYRRIVTAARTAAGGKKAAGAFWHDISRALGGRLGPYPGREWALAGAAAFTQVRALWKAQPIQLSLKAPSSAPAGINFQCRVTLKNISTQPVRNIDVAVEQTPLVEPASRRRVRVPELAAGAELTLPFVIRITALDARRGNRFMVAVRARWPRGEYGEEFPAHIPPVAVAMKYVQAR